MLMSSFKAASVAWRWRALAVYRAPEITAVFAAAQVEVFGPDDRHMELPW